MRRLILGAIMTGLTVIGFASAAGACFLFGYQPKTPACLRK
ncbi:MAG: cyclic lactone autoinducer peptide [Firmicutes bacterium]|nr:cyclic lactone autoinducer peptide [Bacillota bacterium]